MSRHAQTKMLLTLAGVMLFVAGGVLGMIAFRATHLPAQTPSSEHLSEGQRLGLSPEQQKQKDAIWAEARQAMTDHRHQAHARWEEQVHQLLGEQLWTKYQQLTSEFNNNASEEREQITQAAVAKTKALLDPAQVKQYEQWLKEKAERYRAATNPASAPATRP